MLVAVELYQLVPGSSGGLVAWLEGLLTEVSRLDCSLRVLLLCRERCAGFWSSAPGQVTRMVLSDDAYFAELDLACEREEVDLLLRSFPLHRDLKFPNSRQLVLVPDLQHESFPEYFSAEQLAERKKNFWQTRSLGAVVVPSIYSQGVVQSHPLGQERRVVVCSPRPSPMPQNRPTLRRNYFVFPANLWPHKNHRRLFQAFRLFCQQSQEGYELLLTGHTLDRWADLIRDSSDLPIRHLGCLSREELHGVLAGARALLFFSLYEGFGLPLLEAFQHGTPVGCSDLPALREVAGDAALYADPSDCEQMAEVMARLAREQPLRDELVGLGQERLAFYDAPSGAQNLLSLMRELAETPVWIAAAVSPEPDHRALVLRFPGGAEEVRLARFARQVLPLLNPRLERPDFNLGLPPAREGVQWLVLVRRPDQALLSLHRHQFQSTGRSGYASEASFGYWLRNQCPSNPQCRMLLGQSLDLAEIEPRLGRLWDREDLFFGLAEHFSGTRQLFCAERGLNFDLLESPEPALSPLAADLTEFLEEHHALDCTLYRKSREMFEERLASFSRLPSEHPWTRRFTICEGMPITGIHLGERAPSGWVQAWTGRWPVSAIPIQGPFPLGKMVKVELEIAGFADPLSSLLEVQLAGQCFLDPKLVRKNHHLVWSAQLEVSEALSAQSLASLTLRSSTKGGFWPDPRRLGMALRSVEVTCA